MVMFTVSPICLLVSPKSMFYCLLIHQNKHMVSPNPYPLAGYLLHSVLPADLMRIMNKTNLEISTTVLSRLQYTTINSVTTHLNYSEDILITWGV